MALSRLRSATKRLILAFSSSSCRNPQLRWPQTTVLLAPLVERGVADSDLATDLIDLGAQFRLLEGKCNLLLGKRALLHDMFPLQAADQVRRHGGTQRQAAA